ncbi:sulfotransferase family protein [Kineobactrum sediminis]|uniref:Sulfotransferase family protein n=1 Tax=Kineobactrum sediminis TaxID=1905677 RepID=A0A2N5XZS8_9GAMM|nr:sulfotransferase family protein [Kineobactrum sediminis]PLW81650.1 sulfotransferase family protein [Kineobactrum sediminis]
MNQKPGRVIAILGMHRSGTSCLTGSLQEAGLDLGECHTWNPYNKKGNRENQAFVDLHDRILADSGGAWDQPPERAIWSAGHLAAGRRLLADHASSAVLGFKDPRALLVLGGWKSLLPDLEYVGIFRHPEAVAESLQNRSQIPREEALSLWYAYNRILYREWCQERFPLLCFDQEETVFNARVDTVVRQLNLDPVASPQRFYDNQLKTFAARSHHGLPWKIRFLYYKLKRASL